MAERRKIDLEAQQVFAQHIQNQENSTYNFTNMFMWSGENDITYDVVEGCLVLFFQTGRQPVSASFPVGRGDKRAAVRCVSDYISEQGLRPVFRNLSDSMAAELQMLYPESFEYVEDRAAADYIYLAEDLINLSGKKLHAKRNHYNYFKNHYLYTYKRLTREDMPSCMSLFKEWAQEKGEDERWLGSSAEATERLLTNFEQLPVRGGGIYIDGELTAFSIGEPVSEDTVLVHLEFATELRGAFNAINREFCADSWADFTYVNREEDMGLPGLRQAKLAYRPVRLLKKFNAVQVKPL